MKSVLISIQPKWCELISCGKKTVELRKSKPKLDVPFKCFIYKTQSRCQVIGEFVCDEIIDYTSAFFDEQEERDTYDIASLVYHSQLKYRDLCSYVGLKDFYGWHISDLVIYDKPKDISEFYVEGDCDCMHCRNCFWFDRGNGYNVEDDCNLAYKGANEHKSYRPIMRPPQSWCYVLV